MHFWYIILSTVVALFLATPDSYASGSITCRGPEISVSWGVSHISGAPMYGNPLKITLHEKEAIIPKSQVVGYYAYENIILLTALDAQMNSVIFDLRYNDKTKDPASVRFKQNIYSIRDCIQE